MLARHARFCALILFLGLCSYHNSFGAPFIFDDYPTIVDNAAIRDVGKPLDIWRFFPQRFLVFYSFALNHAVGGYDVTGYHIVNLLIHLVNGCLVYWLVLALFRFGDAARAVQTLAPGGHVGGGLSTALAACITALIFTCHPLQTQAVTYIWQRCTSLVALFFLLAMVLHIEAMVSQRAGNARWRIWFGASLTCGVLAMICKQNSFALPFVIFLIEWFFRDPAVTPRRALLARCLPWAATIGIIPLSTLVSGDPAIGHIKDLGELNAYEYFCTQIHVLYTYIRLVLWPVNLNLDYEYPYFTTLFRLETLIRLAGLLAIGTTALLLRRRAPVVAFGVLFFFLAQATVSSFLPLADVIFEHRVYLSLVGMGLVVAVAVRSGFECLEAHSRISFNKITPKKRACLTHVLLALAVSPLVFATVARNTVWQSRTGLWRDVVHKSPGKYRGWDNLGHAHLEAGEYENAGRAYEHAVALEPGNAEALNKLGVAYANQGMVEKAETIFQKVVEMDPGKPEAVANAALNLIIQGKLREADRTLQQGIASNPEVPLLDAMRRDLKLHLERTKTFAPAPDESAE